jgi:hypothetical protein
MTFLKRFLKLNSPSHRKADPSAASVAPDASTRVELAGYVFELPAWFAEPELRSTDEFSMFKTVAGNLNFDVLVAPGRGDELIDDYFGAALRRFEDGRARGFDLKHMGQPFRGWLIDQSPTLSSTPGSFVQYYGTIAEGDAVCFSWAAFESVSDDSNFETLLLTIVYAAIARGRP